MDFAIALLLFTFTVAVYFSYTNNFQKEEKSGLDFLISDAKALSSSLVLSGYPSSWDNTTVVRIGIADEQKINATKVKLFKKYDYKSSKKKFGTQYDFIVFFLNNKGEVLNINGVCAIGYPLLNVSYNIGAAYYYQDPADSFLKDFMNQTMKADIYFNDQGNDIYGLYGFISNLSKYNLVMMEHPLMSGGDYNAYKDKIENYSSSGGLLMLSGELTTSNGKELIGADFFKKAGQSESQRTAIVNSTDQYLSLAVGQSMVFNQYYYVENVSSSSQFKTIATFNQTGDNAIAKWQYGNGTVYFFSDFDVSFFSGDFVKIVEDTVSGFIEGTCDQINVTGLPQKNLVKMERYLNYNSKVTRMVVYLWQ